MSGPAPRSVLVVVWASAAFGAFLLSVPAPYALERGTGYFALLTLLATLAVRPAQALASRLGTPRARHRDGPPATRGCRAGVLRDGSADTYV